MKVLDRFELIRGDLARLEAKLRDTSDIPHAPLAQVLVHLVDAGGKRLRPALALLVGRLYPADAERALALAAAVEMLHTATLVHDDLIDHAALRRGFPTLNTVWTPAATILAGDFLFARAARYAAETESVRVVNIFAGALRTIVEGELRQMFHRPNGGLPTREAYYERIYGKTAALFAASTEAAAELGGAPAAAVAAMRDYGYHLGMAFQVIDDILDFTADEAELGKPVGRDLREGLITLPVLVYAAAKPDAEPLTRLLELGPPRRGSGSSAERDAAVADVVTAVRASGAIEWARAEATAFVEQAQKALAAAPAGAAREALADLARYVVARRD